MRMYDLIVKKRDGGVLSKEEIAFMIDEYTAGSIPDYQMSAMMMAVYFRGMNESETLNLTMSMARVENYWTCPELRESRWTSTVPAVWEIKPR